MAHKKECLNLRAEAGKNGKAVENKPKINARIHAMIDYKAKAVGDMVTSTLLVNTTAG